MVLGNAQKIWTTVFTASAADEDCSKLGSQNIQCDCFHVAMICCGRKSETALCMRLFELLA